MAEKIDCKEMVERVVATLTKSPVHVEMVEDKHGAVFQIFCTDTAFLRGKKNRTIEAVRTLSKALGYNGKHRIRVLIRERSQQS